MADNVLMSVCYNGDETFVDMLEISYNTVWTDLEAMFKARLHSDSVNVSFMDIEDNEVFIGSQEELFEAFRMAMNNTKDMLQVKVMSLSPETPVLRMPDVEEEEQHMPSLEPNPRLPQPQVIDRKDECNRQDGPKCTRMITATTQKYQDRNSKIKVQCNSFTVCQEEMATAEGEHGSDFEEAMFCEPCNKDGNTVEADGFCSDCSDYLCSTCLKYHKRLAKNHTLLDKSNMPQDFSLERCLVHPNDLVKFYCPKCDDTACSECIPFKHQTECSDFKHIPSYMQSQDVYRQLKEVKKSLKDAEEEASLTEDETGQKLKQVNLDKSDISKSISLQKKYIKDKIEEQRVEIFKALDEERVEVIRKLDERQCRRKEQLFEQQKLINSKIEDEERHLADQLMLYPKTMQNIALNSAKIRSKLESLTTELVNKERQGRKAELFLASRRVKHNMKTLQRDIDDVREENVARCFSFRPSKEDISIDAPENVSLGCLCEKNQQRGPYEHHATSSSRYGSATWSTAKFSVRPTWRSAEVPVFVMPPAFQTVQHHAPRGQNMPMMFNDHQSGQIIPFPGPGFPGMLPQQAQRRDEPLGPPTNPSGPPPPYQW